MLKYSSQIATSGQWYHNPILDHYYVLIVSPRGIWMGDPFSTTNKWRDFTERDAINAVYDSTLTEEEWKDTLKEVGISNLIPIKTIVTISR